MRPREVWRLAEITVSWWPRWNKVSGHLFWVWGTICETTKPLKDKGWLHLRDAEGDSMRLTQLNKHSLRPTTGKISKVPGGTHKARKGGLGKSGSVLSSVLSWGAQGSGLWGYCYVCFEKSTLRTKIFFIWMDGAQAFSLFPAVTKRKAVERISYQTTGRLQS